MFLRRYFTPLLLALTSLLLTCYIFDRWTIASWQVPLQLHGDPLEIYARVQAASEDLCQPVRGFAELPRLAAPFGADWRRYPISDRIVFTGLGLVARVTDAFTAVNLAIALVHILNALSFYACARFLRWHMGWAFALALIFSFASYNIRWGVTVSFSLTFFVPPLLLLCGWIARSAPAVRPRAWTILAGGLGLWLGGANPYFGFFAGQLVGLSVLLQFIRCREPGRWRVGLIFGGALAASFVIHNAAYFLAPIDAGSRLTLVRSYAGSEIYALKLTDLLLPPSEHILDFAAHLGRAYQAQSYLRGEFFVNYLGVFGVIGLALLCWATGRAVLTRHPTRLPDAALGVAWTLLFSAVGGFNSLLALGGLDLFRASNRNSVFILVWALWFFGRWCQQHLRSRPWLLSTTIAVIVALVGLSDGVPRLHAGSTLRRHGEELRDNRELMELLETRLGTGARVFQVPAPQFPEAGSTVTMSDYEHFLPYLTSTTIRFSYGALRGTALARGLQALARVPAKLLRDELEATGFHAIWIDRRGLGEPDTLIRGLRSLGLTEISHPQRPEIVIFHLDPADHPRTLDLTDPALFEAWDMVLALPRPRVAAFEGWFEFEKEGPRFWRWAQNHATAGLVMPEADEIKLTFRARALSAGNLALRVDDHDVWNADLTPGTDEACLLPLKLSAGRHRLTWNFSGELVRPVSGDARLLGFAVENLRVRLASDPTDRPPGPRPPGGNGFPSRDSTRRYFPPPPRTNASGWSPESNSPKADESSAEASSVRPPSQP